MGQWDHGTTGPHSFVVPLRRPSLSSPFVLPVRVGSRKGKAVHGLWIVGFRQSGTTKCCDEVGTRGSRGLWDQARFLHRPTSSLPLCRVLWPFPRGLDLAKAKRCMALESSVFDKMGRRSVTTKWGNFPTNPTSYSPMVLQSHGPMVP